METYAIIGSKAGTARKGSALFRALFLLLPILIGHCGLRPLSPDEPLLVCGGRPVEWRSNAERFGVFSERLYQNYGATLDSLTVLFDARPGHVLWFQQIDDPFPAAIVAENASRSIGTVISLNIKSLRLAPARNDTLLREITLGIWDSTLAAFAAAASQAGTTVHLRFGYEMNGNWFPWGWKPDAFRAAWLHARALFRRTGAANVKWIFSPNVMWGDAALGHDFLSYYPGDSAVDVVGLDGYNFGDGYDGWHSWRSFRDVFGPSLRALQVIDKPLWIAETGCPSDTRRAAWLEELFGFMDDNMCVEAVLWFNAHKAGEPDFRIESDSASLGMAREWLGR